jgi:hypothetical protein
MRVKLWINSTTLIKNFQFLHLWGHDYYYFYLKFFLIVLYLLEKLAMLLNLRTATYFKNILSYIFFPLCSVIVIFFDNHLACQLGHTCQRFAITDLCGLQINPLFSSNFSIQKFNSTFNNS